MLKHKECQIIFKIKVYTFINSKFKSKNLNSVKIQSATKS